MHTDRYKNNKCIWSNSLKYGLTVYIIETDSYTERYIDMDLRQCHDAVWHKEHVSCLLEKKNISLEKHSILPP